MSKRKAGKPSPPTLVDGQRKELKMKKAKAKEVVKLEPAERTSSGLRSVLFDELDSLRSGSAEPGRANAVAKLASTIVETVRMELDVARLAPKTGRTSNAPLGKPLALSA